ncbi:Probable methyltransferase PMT23 [Linum perenne]
MSLGRLMRERTFGIAFFLFLFVFLVSITFFFLSSGKTVDLPYYFSLSDRSDLSSAATADPHPDPPPPEETISPKDSPALKARKANFPTVPALDVTWSLCRGEQAVDYIPCLDNTHAIKSLRSRRHMEHRERHCPKPAPTRCLIPLPKGYKPPLHWPKSRDMIWYDNVPHPKLVEYKKNQNWVRKEGDHFVFPGGGTQFKDGVASYAEFIQQTVPAIHWGRHIRVALDVGCGVASFGGYLLSKQVLTMSIAPKDEHDAQIQFALERGIPAFLSVIGTQQLVFPDNAFDLVHCARCRVHWDAGGGKPLLELNRILRPGGFFVWSATPVYRDDKRDASVWKIMVALTESMCWNVVAKTTDSTGIGMVIYQKPESPSCYEKRRENKPPLCDQNNNQNVSWYTPLRSCISRLPVDKEGKVMSWPVTWPYRINTLPVSLPSEPGIVEQYKADNKRWAELVSDTYLMKLNISWSGIRNILDMNAGYGGFAAALNDLPFWVMNVIPVTEEDTLPIIYDRGMIGVYHDWCESFNTYPRTYDLVHANFFFRSLSDRCDLVDVVLEIDRIVRPGGYLLAFESMNSINKLTAILKSLHWSVKVYEVQYMVAKKDFWRPS